jgi:hypothetical protein
LTTLDGYEAVLGDGDDGRLLARRIDDSGQLGLRVSAGEDSDSVSAFPADLPDMLVKLFRVAGCEPPVMLGRPVIDSGRPAEAGPFRLRLDDRGQVVLGYVPEGGGEQAAEGALAPHRARLLAALLAAYADAAEALDPADVAELALLVKPCLPEMRALDGRDLAPGLAVKIAETVLRDRRFARREDLP